MRLNTHSCPEICGIARHISLSWLFSLSIMGVTDFNLRNASGFLRIAISAYVLVAIVKKRLAVEASLYATLQVLSLTVSEKHH
jgi:hypothetical protein